MIDTSPKTDDNALDGPLLFGRVLDGKGGGRSIGWEEAQHWQPGSGDEVLWLHLCRTCHGVWPFLSGLEIPEPTAELLVSESTRPRAFREGETLVATLRGINFNPGAQPEDMVSMQLWASARRVITLRRLPLQNTRDTLGELDAGTGPRDAGALVTSLIEHIIMRMNQSIVDMNEHIDHLEDLDLSRFADVVLEQVTAIRRECLALKRHMGPQHAAFEAIARDAPRWFEDHDRREMSDSIARLRRYLDDLDISKESAIVLQDDIRARSVARNQRTTFLLTIVATIFMPLTFFTGLLGSNVAGIPGAESPLAFWGVVALCGVILLVQLALFRKWKWL